MAIAYELQVIFGGDTLSRRRFVEHIEKILSPVSVHGRQIHIHPPKNTFVSVAADGSVHHWDNMSLYPRNVGFGVSHDDGGRLIRLGDDEMLALALGMYKFLHGAPGYVAAIAGWEIGVLEHLIPQSNTPSEHMPEGLVLHNEIYRDVIKPPMVVFDDQHHWLPLTEEMGNTFGEEDGDDD